MNIKRIADRGGFKWVITWENGEWEQMKNKFEEMGLTRTSTSSPFGHPADAGESVEYYQEVPDNLLLDKLRENPLLNGIHVMDSINAPIVQKGRGVNEYLFNIAVLRVVPHSNPANPEQKISAVRGTGTAGIDYFTYGKKYNEDMKMIYESMFSTPTDVEVIIKPRRMVL